MSYVYSYQTDLGYIPRFTSESNTLANMLPEGRYASYANPSQAFRDTGNAVVVQPISGSPYIATRGNYNPKTKTFGPGEYLSLDEMRKHVGEQVGRTSRGVPIILGEPIEMQKLSEADAKNVTTLTLDIPGHSPVAVIVLIIVLAVIAIVAWMCVNVMRSWATGQVAISEQERQKTLQAQTDLLAQRMTRLPPEKHDINGDGIDDIQVDTWGNGQQLTYAISDYGAEYLGTTGVVETKPAEELPEGFMQAAICPTGTVWDPTSKSCKPIEEKPWWQDILIYGIIAAVLIGALYFLGGAMKKKE